METRSEIKQRTKRQNDSLYLYFHLVARTLNDAGLDLRKTLKPEIDIPWSKTSVKQYLWLPIMQMLTAKDSTAQLSTSEVTEVYEVLNRFLGEKLGTHVEFPSLESFALMQNEENL